jgi:hypothetical protein
VTSNLVFFHGPSGVPTPVGRPNDRCIEHVVTIGAALNLCHEQFNEFAAVFFSLVAITIPVWPVSVTQTPNSELFDARDRALLEANRLTAKFAKTSLVTPMYPGESN